MLFAPDDRAHIWLADTDDTVITSAAFVLVHLPLLGINILDHPVTVEKPTG